MTRRRELADRLRDAVPQAADLPALAQTVYDAVAWHIPFDFGCFATTDTATGLISWASKTRSLGVGDEEFAAAEYGPPDLNTFNEIASRRPPVGALSLDTGGRPETCRRHREFMSPRFAFTDELRVAFVSRGAVWAVLGLYRGAGDPPFTAHDAAALGSTSELVADAVQRALFCLEPTFPTDGTRPTGEVPAGPAVLIIDAADQVTHRTPAAQRAIEEFGGWDHGSLPANVLAVVASTRTRAEHTDIRVRGQSGQWLSIRAIALAGPPACRDVVVTIEPTPRAALSRLALAAHGLTSREEDVALLVLQGADTRAIAGALHLSPHTVQDHLKQIFTKLGVTSRRQMTARLVLT